jgi:chorismate-pyruvate lyase
MPRSDSETILAPWSVTGEEPPVSAPWLALLQQFYARAGLFLPALQPLRPAEVPAPYHGLLVHSADMTPTLQNFYRSPMAIRVLNRERHQQSYFREVVLRREDNSQPVEYGVIRICLDRLPATAARRVLEEQRPLGGILQAEAIPHLSWPQNFFAVSVDAHIAGALHIPAAGTLYGRRNVLLDASRRLIADVIEVLAPADQNHHE